MKKLLILGRGQIGSALAQDFSDFELHIWPHDIDDLSSDVIETIAPDAIINAAGKTDLAWCEANAGEALRSNLEAPVRLYQRILKLSSSGNGVRFIHFSSGCIWDGPYNEKGDPFEPNDSPTPACLYSWTKAAADAMMLSLNPDRISILRPRQVYSSITSTEGRVRNTLLKMMKYPKLVDTPNSVSSMTIIEKTLRYILEANDDRAGTWNIYDRGITSPFEIGEMLWHSGLREKPERISKEALDAFHKPKRVDTVLYDPRFEAVIKPEGVKTILLDTIEQLHEHFLKDNSGISSLKAQAVPDVL